VIKKIKKIDIYILLFLPFLAGVFVLSFNLNYFSSILLFYGLPAIWLTFRNSIGKMKLFTFSVLVSIPYVVILDTLGIINNSWVVPKSFFETRFYGIPFEDFLWLFLCIFLILSFHTYFLKKGEKIILLNKVFIFFLSFVYLIAIGTVLVQKFNPALILIPYPYLSIGLLLAVPMIVAWIIMDKRIVTIKNSLSGAAYFFLVTGLFELVGLALGHWQFPGQYIAQISLAGNLIPLEEILFVMIGGTFITIIFYRFTIEYFSNTK